MMETEATISGLLKIEYAATDTIRNGILLDGFVGQEKALKISKGPQGKVEFVGFQSQHKICNDTSANEIHHDIQGFSADELAGLVVAKSGCDSN